MNVFYFNRILRNGLSAAKVVSDNNKVQRLDKVR